MMVSSCPVLTKPQQASVDQYFHANLSLYWAFSQACQMQFPKDVAAMHAAVLAGDVGSIRRLAHSLKTVFQMLGHTSQYAQALALEVAAGAADTLAIEQLWPLLCEQIQGLTNRLGSQTPSLG